MPRINPVPVEQMPTSLAMAVDRARATRVLSSTLPVQIWAHRPAVASAWLAALEELHLRGVLDARLRELVRLKIASITDCRACQVARKSDAVTDDDIDCLSSESDRFTGPERAALRFAELFAGRYTDIDDSVYAELATFFSVAEIVELNMFCVLMLAGGRMTYVQQAYEETPP